MRIKRFLAKDMKDALAQIKAEMGVDAVIMSNKKVVEGIEVTAAVDQEEAPEPAVSATRTSMRGQKVGRDLSADTVSLSSKSKPISRPDVKAGSMSEKIMREEPASLKDFLERQQHRLQQVTGKSEDPLIRNYKAPAENVRSENSKTTSAVGQAKGSADEVALAEMRDEFNQFKEFVGKSALRFDVAGSGTSESAKSVADQ